jgi:ribosomal protein S18 acetylase RimI-like enzyme
LLATELTAEQVLALFHEQSTILLLCLGPKIVACVHVQGVQSGAYIGMLATNPAMQAQGLGKQMLLHAEAYATEHLKASVFKMSVLSSTRTPGILPAPRLCTYR